MEAESHYDSLHGDPSHLGRIWRGESTRHLLHGADLEDGSIE